MRKITRITTQVKNKSRYNIFLNTAKGDEYGFSVDEAILIEFHLRKGLELDDNMLTTLAEKDTIYKSYTQAINFLSYRMRTNKEIRDYLVKKEVDPEHIEQIISRLKDENLIDDQQFANMFVRSRINTTAKGPKLIKKELIEKGVSANQADVALSYYPLEIQFEKIKKLIHKKLNAKKNVSFQKQVQQLQTNLMQKGFSNEAIKEALTDIQNNKNDDGEWNALVHQGEKLIRKQKTKYRGFELRQKLMEGLYRKGFPFEMINKYLDEQNEELASYTDE